VIVKVDSALETSKLVKDSENMFSLTERQKNKFTQRFSTK